jgi:hypothetical protein
MILLIYLQINTFIFELIPAMDHLFLVYFFNAFHNSFSSSSIDPTLIAFERFWLFYQIKFLLN